MVRRASTVAWSKLQRVLIHPAIEELILLADGVAAHVDGRTDQVDFCREKLRLPGCELNPPALINGDDLSRAGLTSGPLFRRILAEVRDAQLEGRIRNSGRRKYNGNRRINN